MNIDDAMDASVQMGNGQSCMLAYQETLQQGRLQAEWRVLKGDAQQSPAWRHWSSHLPRPMPGEVFDERSAQQIS
jgi:hypothetical protein